MRSWRSVRARAGAFTLIELMVVTSIVGVLTAMLLPALGGGRAAGRSVRCLAHLRSIGQSVVLYQSDFQDYFPISSHTTGSLLSPAGWLRTLVDRGLEPAAACCPADEYRGQKLTSYATNDYLEPLTAGIDFNPVTGRTLPGGRRRAITRVIHVPRPAEVIFAVEAAGEGTVDHIHAVGWDRASQVGDAIAVQRHRGAANYLYVDGHAAALAWARLAASFSAQSNPFNPESAG